jgi:phosphohistidine phosphatase
VAPNSCRFDAGAVANQPRHVTKALSEPHDIGPSTTVEHAAIAIVDGHVTAMLRCVPVVRAGAGSESIHDMRVAGRRLRSALQSFKRWLPPGSAHLQGELRWLMRILGTVRDLDVQISLIEKHAQALENPDAATPALEYLRRRRAGAHQRVAAALSSVRFRRCVGGLNDLAAIEVEGVTTVSRIARSLVAKHTRALRKATRRARHGSSEELWHEVRVRAKHARYLIESLAFLAPHESQRSVKSLRSLQDRLGRRRDAVVASTTLAVLSRTSAIPAGAKIALQQIAESIEREHQRSILPPVDVPTKLGADLDRALRVAGKSRRVVEGMELILVRHAIAGETDRSRWPDDADRPLTEEGEKRFRDAARGLVEVVSTPNLVIASRFVRAWRTAELLVEEAGWPEPQASAELEPDGSSVDILHRLSSIEAGSRVALVGHEPSLSRLASWLLCGSEDALDLALKKGGAVVLAFDREVQPDGARLQLWLTPKAMRSMRD